MTYPYDGVRSLICELNEEIEYLRQRVKQLEEESKQLKEEKQQFVKKLKK
jgi:cell division protein FtsB